LADTFFELPCVSHKAEGRPTEQFSEFDRILRVLPNAHEEEMAGRSKNETFPNLRDLM
jgi:hypothetical protein